MGHSPMHFDAHLGYVGELHRVVHAAEYRLGEVLPDLVPIHVEGRGEFDIGDVIAPEIHVHQSGHEFIVGRVLVELHALDQRRGTVAHTNDRDPHLSTHHKPPKRYSSYSPTASSAGLSCRYVCATLCPTVTVVSTTSR